ncbi:MAG: DUF4080 domain-containing protein, partial [Deltaproteobacteria bacterium CG_4_10_14_3_um_filter_60_8]
ADLEADALFFSVYIWNVDYVRRLVADLATLRPDCPIVMGGPQVTYGPQPDWPGQCTIVRGEIEAAGAAFFADLRAGNLKREYEAGVAAAFPSPYREVDFAGPLRNRAVYYESSRGCPFSCSYCLSSATTGVRHKGLTEVFAELRSILPHQPKSLRFVDRTFNADRQRALAIWRFLAEHAGPTKCHFEISPDLFDEEMFVFLARVPAGLFEFEIGLQTTNPASLAAVNRTMNLELAQTAIARLAAMDTIHLHLDLILGLPHETTASFRASVNAAISLAPHYLQMGLLKVLPGTGIQRRQAEFGIECGQSPPYPVLASRWLERRSLSRLFWFGKIVEAFFNNRYFRTFFRYLRATETDLSAFFDGLLAHCQATGFFSLSPTQELMARMLCEITASRADHQLLLELLRYDWLRCGHRFLPDSLRPAYTLRDAQNFLWQELPQNLPPFYDHAGRNEFFKQATFARFSGPALKETGLSQGLRDGLVVFLPERTASVERHQRAVLMPMTPPPLRV